MEHCCHLWARAPKSHLQILDRIEKRARNLMGQQLANELLPLSEETWLLSVSSTDNTSANAALRLVSVFPSLQSSPEIPAEPTH